MKILNCTPPPSPPPPTHGELCTTCTAQLSEPHNHHTDCNIIMYRALLKFPYSLENKPLYFPVTCKVLKEKMKYTSGKASFLTSLSSVAVMRIFNECFGTASSTCQDELCQELSLSSFIYVSDLEGSRLVRILMSHRRIENHIHMLDLYGAKAAVSYILWKWFTVHVVFQIQKLNFISLQQRGYWQIQDHWGRVGGYIRVILFVFHFNSIASDLCSDTFDHVSSRTDYILAEVLQIFLKYIYLYKYQCFFASCCMQSEGPPMIPTDNSCSMWKILCEALVHKIYTWRCLLEVCCISPRMGSWDQTLLNSGKTCWLLEKRKKVGL